MLLFSVYCSGESYAGIYIPMLANNIRLMNGVLVVPLEQKINLKGLMVYVTVSIWYIPNFMNRLHSNWKI